MIKREYNFYVYIMPSVSGALYVGMTNDLVECFTKKYSRHKLVYYEHFTDVYEVINREKQIKR